MRTTCLAFVSAAVVTSITACSDPTTGGNEEEVITTVTVTVTPQAGGAARTFTWNDPDGDGGAAPTIDTIAVAAGDQLTLAVGFQNRLADPVEEITTEIRDESDAHQIFFTGSAVNGPATAQPSAPLTHAYADTDVNGLPIGLASTLSVTAGVPGDLIITLRHMPPINGVAVKTAGAAATVASGGFAALGGSTDAQVTFPVAIAVP